MKKVKVVFDASLLGEGYDNANQRTGLYRSAYEILKNLTAIDSLHIIATASQLNYQSSRIAVGEISSSVEFHEPATVSTATSILRSLRELLSKFCNVVNRLKLPGRGLLFKLLKHYTFFLESLSLKLQIVDNDLEFDIYFSPFAAVPNQIRDMRKVKCAIFVHDLLPITHPHFCESRFITTFYKVFVDSIRRDDLIFVNSESTKSDLLKARSDLKNSNVIKCLLAADAKFRPNPNTAIMKKLKIPTAKFFLSVSAINKRKNMGLVIDSFIDFCKKNKASDCSLVLVGPKGVFFDETMQKINNAGVHKDRIILTGFITDDELIALYSLCTAYVFMSHYEGFGLTVLEAMGCGAPIIVSNVSSLPEVAGGAAILVEPNDKFMLVRTLDWLYKNEKMRSDLSLKSQARFAKFSWSSCASIIAENLINKVR